VPDGQSRNKELNVSDKPEIAEIIALLKSASAAAAYEAAGKRGDVDVAIRAMVPGAMCVGPAFTIKAHQQRAAGVNMLLDQAPPGSVIVIDAGHDRGNCVFGGTGALAAQMRGVAGCVTNACIRDAAELRHLNFPTFAAGSTVRSGRNKELSAEPNVPVTIGNQIVSPGDLIVADDDGVVVIAQEYFEGFAERLRARLAFEQQADALVRQGTPYGQAIQPKAA
jgi:4-hydroxy-4-methyl-2-oxoglutarate aldolase